jgi:hypothetical protein
MGNLRRGRGEASGRELGSQLRPQRVHFGRHPVLDFHA